ncbi:hypothetical protein TMEN_6333 [Trichophyton mentagrophytes]|uniref:Uncharacterized protein n=3 Tax=Trichophyton TaxID=5550 RepID=A0A9P5CYZ8_9EURO|nr:hypothetical protein GY631_1842 [Trichophyton interdigitale]KAF3898479.1 hypothetical protein GY632_1755 [Trichophyton interdigitale]KAG8210500.1 hypothetical protein GTR04_2084 [Trichophyton interdigitale]KDB23898.1 hypothetical protein H109_04208 [Trichophyton interdigitale MR816]GBF63689.1 hypothetical protein TMEN_6333 [Trichophyton mentagrophytes]
MITTPTFAEMEDTARAVILCLKKCPDLAHTKVAIIGGAAICRYVAERQPTDDPEDVDFMITIPNAEVAHRRLLQTFDTMFTEYEGCLYYSHPGGKQIKVDFSTNCRLPYMPMAATIVRDVDIDCLPYIGPTDLLVLSIRLCGQRNSAYSHIDRDSADAVALAETIVKEGPVVLSPIQRQVVREELAEVVHWGPKDETWWRGVLAAALSSKDK